MNSYSQFHSCRLITGFYLVAFFWMGRAAESVSAEAPQGQLIGNVWAGHPVSFDFLTVHGHQFIAYYDENREIVVASRELHSDNWTAVHPGGRWNERRKRPSNVIGWDSHNFLRLAADSEGCIHLSGNMHVDPLVYYRTARPLDITSLERLDRMTGDDETDCTYPVFFNDADGRLLFRYRDGRSGNGRDIYDIYDTRTRIWRRLLDTPLLDGQGHRNAYAMDPMLGPDKRFHLVWMWRESPDCSTNNTLSYARSSDFIHWETSTGKPLTLPLTIQNAEVVDPSPPQGGLINMTFKLGFDEKMKPVVAYHRYDSDNHSQLFLARPNGATWMFRAVSDWTFQWKFNGSGSIAADVKITAPQLDAKGQLRVFFDTREAGGGGWLVQANTLEPIAKLKAPDPLLPGPLLVPVQQSDMEVQTAVSVYEGRRYILRWETLPRNRDEPRSKVPAPSVMRMYEFPDDGTPSFNSVGS